ncbi:hypothetical protein H4R34_003798 [Dimargaris verticillata]|uniref:Uncharacterized protein n=1 Tax=Dimargaris verticillata TaxID=2761393 RepID=A0A9W8ECA0_9FUNG|nr:hypothetical protein H4R34_003798 [Dimargaris verticillata]
MGWLYARIGQTCKEGLHVQVNLPSEEESHAQVDLFSTKEPYAQVDLSSVKGVNGLVGLRTLLDGTQLELRAMVRTTFIYRYSRASGNNGHAEFFKELYTNILQKYPLPKMDVPLDVLQSINNIFGENYVHPNKIKHNLANLGLTLSVDDALVLVEALFEALKSSNLLANFQTIVEEALSEPQGNQGENSNDQATMTKDPVKLPNHRANTYTSLRDEIAGNDADKLRYYLSSLLVFDIIPHIIGQMFEKGQDKDALKFAEQINGTAGLKWVVKQFPDYVPDYFEFIVQYAIKRQLPEREDLIEKAHPDKANKGVDIRLIL